MGSAEKMNMLANSSHKRPVVRIGIAVVLLPLMLGFGSPLRRLTEQGNKAFGEKRYDEALTHYKNAQVESPESPALHFNIGDVLIRQKKYDKGIEEFQKIPGNTNDQFLESKAYYNVGVAQYRTAEQEESLGKISEALKSLEQCMESNRIAMRKNPDDPDPKYNFEQAKRKWKELYAKYKDQQAQQQQQLAQEQKQQQQQGQQQAQAQQQEQQSKSEQQKEEQAQQAEKKQESQQQQQAQAAEQQNQTAQQGQPQQEKPETGEMTKADAMRLLNSLPEENREQFRQMLNQHFRGSLDMENDW
jgi:Ca-activated chloride channel family protein